MSDVRPNGESRAFDLDDIADAFYDLLTPFQAGALSHQEISQMLVAVFPPGFFDPQFDGPSDG